MTETGSASAGPVSSYLAELSPDVAAALGGIVARAHELIPDLEEGTSYSMAALMHRGKALLSVVETKKHLGYYPFSGKVISLVASELPGSSTPPARCASRSPSRCRLRSSTASSSPGAIRSTRSSTADR